MVYRNIILSAVDDGEGVLQFNCLRSHDSAKNIQNVVFNKCDTAYDVTGFCFKYIALLSILNMSEQ